MPTDSIEAGWLTRLSLTQESRSTAVITPAATFTRGHLYRSVLATVDALHPLSSGQVAQLRFHRGDPRSLVATLAVWEIGAIPLFQDAAGSPEPADAVCASVGAVVKVEGREGGGEDMPLAGVPSLSIRWLEPTTMVDLGADDAGYLVQTSGSSGVPRVSFNTSSGLRNVVDGLVDRYGLAEGSRALQFAPLGYDAWLADALPALRAGGSLAYGPVGEWSGLRVVERVITELGVTHAVLPPSVWRRMKTVDSLEVAISAGEALDVRTARGLSHAVRRVVNAYGPSEAAICSMTYDVRGDEVRVPLGEALPGVEVSTTDDEIGRRRLRIAGVGVAHGYVGETQLAKDRDQARGSGWFGVDDRGRFFQTSDVVEVVAGEVYFVGRADRMIKHRGRLVNLEQVEAAVRALAGVTDCVASVVDDHIVCDVVAEREDSQIGPALLASTLESWEIPTELRFKADLKRSPSDKLDLSPTPTQSHDPTLDQRVRAIWVRAVGSDEERVSYFALGGDSLGAMELLDELAVEVGVEIDIADFVADPTLASLGRLVAQCDPHK